MGSGTFTAMSYESYAKSVGRSVCLDGTLDTSYTAQDLFQSKRIQPELSPFKIMRECCDTEEHPYTIPVILALDVTGSMGGAAAEVAKKLSEIMTKLYDKVTDVEFMIMGIGDLAYDAAPIQVSQFESDIRIAEQLDKIYFERGGGGNAYESYTAAWYIGSRHTKLDCWKRGKKGIIITMGDEKLNPYLPKRMLSLVTGDELQGDIETSDLYREVTEKYDVYHLAINDPETSYEWYKDEIQQTFGKYLDNSHLLTVGLNDIASKIVNIVVSASKNNSSINTSVSHEETGVHSSEISW